MLFLRSCSTCSCSCLTWTCLCLWYSTCSWSNWCYTHTFQFNFSSSVLFGLYNIIFSRNTAESQWKVKPWRLIYWLTNSFSPSRFLLSTLCFARLLLSCWSVLMAIFLVCYFYLLLKKERFWIFWWVVGLLYVGSRGTNKRIIASTTVFPTWREAHRAFR